MMPVFTLEVDGRPVVAIRASSFECASETVEEKSFRADLMALDSEDRPLWDGKAPTYLRTAHPEEVATVERSFAKAVRSGEAEMDMDREWVVFLVPVTDPSDEGHDEAEL